MDLGHHREHRLPRVVGNCFDRDGSPRGCRTVSARCRGSPGTCMPFAEHAVQRNVRKGQLLRDGCHEPVRHLDDGSVRRRQTFDDSDRFCRGLRGPRPQQAGGGRHPESVGHQFAGRPCPCVVVEGKPQRATREIAGPVVTKLDTRGRRRRRPGCLSGNAFVSDQVSRSGVDDDRRPPAVQTRRPDPRRRSMAAVGARRCGDEGDGARSLVAVQSCGERLGVCWSTDPADSHMRDHPLHSGPTLAACQRTHSDV